MSSRNENVRLYLTVLVLSAFALAVGTRLVLLHLDLIDTKPPQPKYTFTKDLRGLRGPIYPAGGAAYPLARSVPVWVYHVDPRSVNLKRHKRDEVVRTVADALGLPVETVRDAYWRTDSRYVALAKSFDTEAHRILSDPALVSGLSIEEQHERRYPQGHRLSHVLGYVSKDPTNQVGAAGIEMRYETLLRGIPGRVKGERDARRNEIYNRRIEEAPPTRGAAIHLTLDHNLQYEVEKILAKGLAEHRAESAWAIVLSVKTGAVLALASLPDFDPESYNRFPDGAKKNRAIGENYEPGSVMKTITACAVINEGLVTPDTMINTSQFDPNYYRLPGDHGHHWDPYMSVRDALVHSSNIVYGKLGVNLGPTRLRKYMVAFGLGARTNVGLPGEECGLLPPLKQWDKVKWSRAPIGQGVAVTALQMASAYAAIGNDGELLRPYVVEKIETADGDLLYQHRRDSRGRPITAETARKVREMMLGVAKKGGTAKRAAVRGYSVAGKTGTAQMKEGRGYSSTAYNASFIGILPASRPEVVILVTFQRPLYCRSRDTADATGVPLYNHQGGLCAAPVFSQIASVAMRYLEVEPDIPDEVPDEEEDDEARTL